MIIIGDNVNRFLKEENYHIVCPKLRDIQEEEVQFDITIPLDRYLNLFTLGETSMSHHHDQLPRIKKHGYMEDRYVAFKMYLITRCRNNVPWGCDFPDYYLSMLSKEFARLASRGYPVTSKILQSFTDTNKMVFTNSVSYANVAKSRCKAIKYTLGEPINLYDSEIAINPLPSYAVGVYQKYRTGNLPIYKNYIYEPGQNRKSIV